MNILKQKAIKGILWNVADRFSQQSIRFVILIILARLLLPKDFGLIGMITVFFAFAQVFIDSGFGIAYIQKKEVTDDDANTVFYTNLFISIILYGILWLAAPAISQFYDQPQLIDLTRVMGLVVVINAFNVIQMAQLIRAVNFKRKTKVTLMATLISGTSGVTAAYCGLGVWSLVIQNMMNHFLITSGLWFTSKWKPAWKFSKESFKTMFSFGSWILFASIIRRIFDNIYILSIGKFFSASQLGFYTNAKQFQMLSSVQFSEAVGVVAFPMFSQLQVDKVKLQQVMRKFLQHSLIFIAPLMLTLIVVAKPFIILLLTEKWAPMIPYLQLLCIIGVLYPLHAINVQVLIAQGKSNLNFKLSMLKNALRIINIIIMYRFGVIFIILGEIIVSLLALFVNTFYTHKLLNYGLIKQWNDINKIVLSAIISGIINYIVIMNLNNLWFMFLVGGTGTLSIFIITQYFFNKTLFMEILSLKSIFMK